MKPILELCFTGTEQLLKVCLYLRIPISLFLVEPVMFDFVFYMKKEGGKAKHLLFSASST